MKALITGFAPFGGEVCNPSIDAVRMLPDLISGVEIYKAEIPTVFGLSGEVLRGNYERIRPDIVISVGQAGGRAGISVEKVAINYIYASRPDNAGAAPFDVPIIEGAPDVYFSTLPVTGIVKALDEAGISAGISYSAGVYVCNELFYNLMHMTAGEQHVRAGFIHVPYSAEQAGERQVPSMPLDMICEALRTAVIAAAETI